MFDLCTEDYLCMPDAKSALRRGKKVVIIPLEEWERYNNEIGICLGNLMIARENIEKMQPVYDEYHEEFDKKHNISIENYINHVVASYNSDEFEAIRDKFEEHYYRQFEDTGER